MFCLCSAPSILQYRAFLPTQPAEGPLSISSPAIPVISSWTPPSPSPGPPPMCPGAVPILRVGFVPSILLWLLAHSGVPGSFRPPPAKLHLHHSNLFCFFQTHHITHHIPGFPLLCFPVLCLKFPSLSPLAASLPSFVISPGSPPPCCLVQVQVSQNPSVQASAYSPKYQTSSETPCLPVSLRTLTSFKFEFLVCVSVDHPCTSKCLDPGGNCICSVHSQETLSLLQSPKVLSLFFFF